MNCNLCSKPIEEERLELLDTTICSECAKSGNCQNNLKAATFYNSDGTTDIQLMDEKQFNKFARDYKNRTNAHL